MSWLTEDDRLKRYLRWLALPLVCIVLTIAFSPAVTGWRRGDPEPEGVLRDLTIAEEFQDYMASGDSGPAGFSDSTEFHAPVEDQQTSRSRGMPAPFDCIIEPSRIISVGSPVIGVIEELTVDRGDDVEAGQVLAQLESGTERAAVEVARKRSEMIGDIESRKASLELGQQRRDRAKQLFEHDALSLDVRQEIETEAKLAELELRRAREERQLAKLELARASEALKRRTVRSPISGVVVERMMNSGEVVDEDPIIKIAQLHPLRVEVILPSAMFGSIKPGMWGAVVPELSGDRVHAALVKIVDRVVDGASGTFGVQLELANPDNDIPGGLHCRVSFLRPE